MSEGSKIFRIDRASESHQEIRAQQVLERLGKRLEIKLPTCACSYETQGSDLLLKVTLEPTSETVVSDIIYESIVAGDKGNVGYDFTCSPFDPETNQIVIRATKK